MDGGHGDRIMYDGRSRGESIKIRRVVPRATNPINFELGIAAVSPNAIVSESRFEQHEVRAAGVGSRRRKHCLLHQSSVRPFSEALFLVFL